jgi:ATP-dependent Lhr-like helicase
MDALSDLLERLRKGRAKLTIVEVSAPSPLAAEGLRIGGGYDRVKVSSMPKHMVAELIKRRLIAKNVRLVCMVCGNSWVSKVSELPQWVSCPKCDVRLVGVARGLDEGVINVVKKGIKAGGRYKFVLTDEEKKLFEHLMKTANLVLIYGKKAVIALMAYGVGPETAKRALAINDEVEFYSKLYELEKLFIRTRKYWD